MLSISRSSPSTRNAMTIADFNIKPSAKILRELGGDRTIGPMLLGIEKPVQIATMSSTASELVTLAVLAAAGTVE